MTGHAGHHHRIDPGTDARRLALALGLIAVLMAIELSAGAIAHSLALLSDAAHMLTDAAALGLSLLAARLAHRPPKGGLTYGFGRVEILAAQANGVTLLILAAFIAYEAARRLVSPPHVHAPLMLAVALLGVLVNLGATLVLAGADRRSLNVEGAFRHILTDLYAFAGTAVAAIAIMLTGFDRADPIASLLVAALMVRAGVGLVVESARVFMEAAPAGIDPGQIGRALASERGVVEVHDLHVWEVTSGFPALSAHVIVAPETPCHDVAHKLKRLARERFGIDHTTFQVDHRVANELLDIESAE